MNEIITRVLEQELQYNNTVILKYRIAYPEITASKFRYGSFLFNQSNRNKALQLERYCRTELFKQAKEVYAYNQANGYPVMVFEVVVNYTVTYNQNEKLSLYSDQYTFTGGAHGNTIRTAQNWNLQTGNLIPLQQFYPNDPYYAIRILQQINKEIREEMENGKDTYFEDYCQLVLETFRLENYYLVPEGIEVFFQQYDIAPYSSGIPTFLIKR